MSFVTLGRKSAELLCFDENLNFGVVPPFADPSQIWHDIDDRGIEPIIIPSFTSNFAVIGTQI